MVQYPRSREETSDPPNIDEIANALKEHWNCAALEIRPAQSRRVHYVDWPHRQVMFRANPGWGGPTPPPTIVNYVAYLSKLNAPAPEIIPTQRGEYYAQLRDYTISVESHLPGEDMSKRDLEFLSNVGARLGQLHSASMNFQECKAEMRPTGEYINAMFERSLARLLEQDEKNAINILQRNIEAEFSEVSTVEIPWILCHSDVRPHNTIATKDGEIWFIDFDSANYAPVLCDLLMTRFQWLFRIMDLPNAADILRGYNKKRPLLESELSAFSAIWAAYYTDRMTFLLDRRRKQKGHWVKERIIQRRDQILRLPADAISMAQDLLRVANLD